MNNKSIKILAIETSCDETAASVLSGTLGGKPKFQLLSSVIKSQIEIHQKFGGVVPEVAARAHMQNILPVVEKGLSDAKTKLADLDYIAVTSGPGLVVSLIVGTEFAKGLSISTGIPLLPTNHIEGHLYSAFGNPSPTSPSGGGKVRVKFPVLCVIVSGLHTTLAVMKDYHNYTVIGNTVDDAAGEAFDKVARLLNLAYPGGPKISKLALEGKTDLNFPRPMVHAKNFDFSFAGLKTAVLYYIKALNKPLTKQIKADIAMSFENAVCDVITQKALRAAQKYNCKTVSLSGGVSANRKLREYLSQMSKEQKMGFAVPSFDLCTDNAGMIAIAAYFNLLNGKKPVAPAKVKADPAWEIG